MGEYPSAICAVHREADVSTRCGEDRGGGEGYRVPLSPVRRCWRTRRASGGTASNGWLLGEGPCSEWGDMK